MPAPRSTPIPADSVVWKLLLVVMLLATVGMTVFMFTAFDRNPMSLVFGGLMIVSILGLMLQRTRSRRTFLFAGAVLIAATVGMAVVMFAAFKGNPTSLMFAGMIVLSTLGMLYAGLQRPKAGPTEDDSKR